MSLTHQLFLQSLRELDGVNQAAFDKHRLPLLATLIDHAWREVPAYRARLAPFIMDESFDLTRWVEMPLLRRTDLAGSGSTFFARFGPPTADIIEDVSISPKIPVARRSQLSRTAQECERERFYEMLDVELSGHLAILHPEQETSATGRGWSITFTRNHWSAGATTASAPEQLEWLIATEAQLLRTNAVLAERLARTAFERPSRLSLDAVIIADDQFPPDLEAIIERAFGAKVLHVVERPVLGVLAAHCGSGGYSVPAETTIVEIVDEAGLPIGPGEIGELVVSPLYEFATPLLRFATEIKAVMPDEPGTILGVRHLAGIRGSSSR